MSEKLLSEQHPITPIEHRNVLVGVISLTNQDEADLVLARQVADGGLVLPSTPRMFQAGPNYTQVETPHMAARRLATRYGIPHRYRFTVNSLGYPDEPEFHGLIMGEFFRLEADTAIEKRTPTGLYWTGVTDFYESAVCLESARALHQMVRQARSR
ncbi:MAG: hypothetical protein WBP26_02560 [Candidatus Saccharimonadales bacterium]